MTEPVFTCYALDYIFTAPENGTYYKFNGPDVTTYEVIAGTTNVTSTALQLSNYNYTGPSDTRLSGATGLCYSSGFSWSNWGGTMYAFRDAQITTLFITTGATSAIATTAAPALAIATTAAPSSAIATTAAPSSAIATGGSVSILLTGSDTQLTTGPSPGSQQPSTTAKSLSSTSTSISTPSGSPTNHGKYNGGEIAGAAVGAAIGAALLAALVTFLCLRRRRYRSPSSTPEMVVYGKGSPGAHSDQTAAGDVAWMKHLPQPADDKTVSMRVNTLYNHIELHVENFYHNVDVRGNEIPDEAQEALLDIDSGLLSPSLPAVLLNTPAKMPVIKHTLAHLVLSNISFRNPPGTSFLPAEYTNLIQNLGKNQQTNSFAAFTQSLSHYRVSTAYLRADPSSDQTYLQQREARINRAATDFATAFEPWSHNRSSNASSCLSNLTEIMRSAADTGIFLFGQPAAFEFQWEAPSSRGQGKHVVALPAFVKTADEKGVALDRPAVMIGQVVEDV